MSALMILAGVGLWFGFGYLIWRLVIRRSLSSVAPRIAVGFLLAAVWLSAPWVDEWFGAREFKRLCEAMPEVRFSGPVAVGPGPFYNEDGSPKWQTEAELFAIMNPLWTTLFPDREEFERIRSSPFPVFERRIVRIYKPTGQLVLVQTERLSPGGWLKRITGWGSHAPYQCPWKGDVARSNSAYVTFGSRSK